MLLIYLIGQLTVNAGAAPSPVRIAEKVQAVYAKAGDISATFEHQHFDSLRGQTRSEKGLLWAKKDGRIRWSYREPVRKDFVYDGDKAFFYEPENAQVTVIENFHESALAGAVGFLVGRGRFDKMFNVQNCAKDCDVDDQSYTIVLTPKKPISGVERIHLKVDRNSYRVVSSTLFDPLGNRTRYIFTDLIFGKTIADKKFAFKIPNGVQVMRHSGN